MSFSVSGNVYADKFDALTLNGTALYSEDTKEIYIARLYLDNLYTTEALIKSNKGFKRMKLDIKALKWNERSFVDTWGDTILKNNSTEVQSIFAEEIKRFQNILQSPLLAGDILTIDYVPNQSTIVSLNGFELMNVDKVEFFNVLLNTWIGSAPPSPEFKNNIIKFDKKNPENKKLLVRVFYVEPKHRQEARAKMIEQWKGVKPKVKELTNEKPMQIGKVDYKSPLGKYLIQLNRETQRRSMYPDEALLHDNISGVVIVKIAVNNKGIVQNAEIAKPEEFEPFNAAALAAVKKSTYPAFPKTIKTQLETLFVTVKFAPLIDDVSIH